MDKLPQAKPVGLIFGDTTKRCLVWLNFSSDVARKLGFALSEESKGGWDYVILCVIQACLDQMVTDCRCKKVYGLTLAIFHHY